MKRWIFVIWMMVMAVASCVKERTEEVYAHDPDFPEGKPVTITFSIPGVTPSTKGLDNGGDLDNLYLAVFGSSGYLKEYVKATPVSAGTYTYPTTDKDNKPISVTVPKYTFTATLAMTESERSIHFIGNGPSTLDFGYDTAVLPVLMSTAGEKAYWQMITLEHGIRAKKEKKTIDGKIVEVYVDADGNALPEGATTGYVPTDETAGAFQEIALVRNWAKVEVDALHSSDPEQESNFWPISMAVVNKPSKGTIVPYSKETGGFVKDYQLRSFTNLSETYKYPGNLPSSTQFDNTIPPADAFEPDGDGKFGEGVAPVSANSAVFLYERPAPSSSIQPTYVIIYGTFKDPDQLAANPSYEGVKCYYKVDLVDTKKDQDTGIWSTNYFPVYRNFKYKITINKILSEGQTTPALAALSAGSADVSADVNTSNVSEISDGSARLHVSPWVANTITSEHNADNPLRVLSVYFSKAIGDNPTGTVSAGILEMEDGSEDILYNVKLADEPDENGFRALSFCNKKPDKLIRTQKIRVTGTYEENGTVNRLYRDIVITVQGEQPLKVRCLKPYLAKSKGTEQTVQFMIPDGLMQSMFPLDFTIEAEDMTLTPDNSKPNNNLPVISGKSISDHDGYAGKTAFQFRKTITWDDYVKLTSYVDSEESSWRVVNCYFKTNRAVSATTVWVYNEYFTKASDFFQNYGQKTFTGLTFNSPIPLESDKEISVSFTLEKDADRTYPDDFPQILISTEGLLCKEAGVSPGPYAGTYYYTPTSEDGKVTLNFITTDDSGDISIELSADEYSDARLVPCHFTHVGFVDGLAVLGSYSNCILGHVNGNVNPHTEKPNANKALLFAYRDDPLSPFVPVTLRIGYVGPNNEFEGEATYKDKTTPSFPYSPVENRSVGDLLYHEIPLKTGSAVTTSPVHYRLSANGYVTEEGYVGRFKAENNPTEIKDMKSVIKPGTTSATLTGKWGKDYNYKCTVSIPTVSGNNSGTQLAAGLTHPITLTTNDSYDPALYMVSMTFAAKNNKILAPAAFLNKDGTPADVEKYMKTDNTYIWHIQRTPGEKLTTATIKLRAPDNDEICIASMVIFDYRRGTFYPVN